MARVKRGVTTHARHRKILKLAKGFIPAPPEHLRIDEPTPVKQPLRDFAEDIRVPQIDRVGSALLDAVS